MKWVKPSRSTIAYFERITPGPPIEARRMFGMPARFLNGHMLVAVFGNTFMLHLSPADRAACLRAGAKPFAPFGREAAKEYVDVKPGTFGDRELKEWIVRGMRYIATLPPKLRKKGTRGGAEGHSAEGEQEPESGRRRVGAKRVGAKRAGVKRAARLDGVGAKKAAAKKGTTAKRKAPKRAVPKRKAAKRPAAKRPVRRAAKRK